MRLLLTLGILTALLNWWNGEKALMPTTNETTLVSDRERDSLALVALYNSTGGENWTNNTNWLSTQSINEWYGVTLNEDGCVICLDLDGEDDCAFGLNDGNNLSGSIPEEVGNLINIQFLNLSINKLTGIIPSSLGNLQNLEQLRLINNNLIGEIPSEIGNLTLLNTLILGDNQLSGDIPKELGQLIRLETLDLQQNDLSGSIPIELGNLLNLVNLILDNNNLTGSIPDEIGQLQSLKLLTCRNNSISGSLPADLWRLFNINKLFLQNNNLEGCYPESLDILCVKGFAANLNENGYNFTNNPLLPWQGDFERYCNGEEQIGASCDDGNPNTENDIIDENCECKGSVCNDLSLQLTELIDATCEGWENGSIKLEVSGGTPPFQYMVSIFNNPITVFDTSYFIGSLARGNFEIIVMDANDCKDTLNIEIANIGIGNPCDDGNPETENDIVSEDCFCEGTPIISCRMRDSLALVALYNSTDGANWTNTWDLNRPMDEWFGVTVNEEGCVISLELCQNCYALSNNDRIGNNLDGSLPTTLGDLLELETLVIIRNDRLVGGIPTELSNLNKLKQLYLHSNQITGSIPPELGSLSQLRELWLSNNKLNDSIPKELGNLSNLEWLLLSDNELSGEIPIELGDLSNLTQLYIRSCGLMGEIPTSLGNLSNLNHLYLNDNELTGEIPSELGALQNLSRLYCQNNQLSGCFKDELTTHCSLGFNGNPNFTNGFTGYNFTSNPLLPWQGDFERFCNGEEQIGANCDDGDLTTQNDIITADCGCVGELIVMNECRERDSLALVALYNSTDGANWTNTWDLNAPMEEWYGVTLNEDGCVTCLALNETETCNIDFANYAGNNLIGELPDLGLTNLEILQLSGNNLTGEIPNFTSLPNLKLIQLGGNNFSGDIPDFANCPLLETISLESCGLSGTIPQFTNLNELAGLYLGDNSLTGEIPAELGNLTNLSQIGLPLNNLSGSIPAELGQLTNLTTLALANNNFTGSIPPELGNLTNLVALQIQINDLTGTIPPELGALTNLINFFLSNNNLEGCFPEELLMHCDISYGFTNNPLLPWQGDFERYCNGEEQIGAACDDGNANTTDERIMEDCTCKALQVQVNDIEECENEAFEVNLTQTDLAPYTCEWQRLGSGNPINSAVFNSNTWIVEVEGGSEYAITIYDAEGTPLRDTVFVRDLPAANTMPNSNECEDNTLITANLPDGTTGFWSGSGIIEPEIEESTAQLDYGDNVFIWLLSKDECDDYSSDTLLVFREGYPIATDDAYCISISQSPLELSLIANDDPSACSDYEITFSESTIAARMTEVSKGVYHFQAQQPNEILEFEYTICNTVCPDFCATASVYLEIVPTIGNILEQPVGITPNGDGLNDVFIIKDLEINSYPQQELRIFNQWGQVIYEANPYENNWDGRNLNGQPVTEGTYYFLLRLGEAYPDRVGRVLLLR